MNKVFHIIGGGLAGLYAAKIIKEIYPDSQTSVYEQAKNLGGRACSFYDKTLQTETDNAAHAVLSCNRGVKALLLDKTFSKAFSPIYLLKHKAEILHGIFNTLPQEISPKLLLKTLLKMFPFFPKVYFSQNNLSKNLINPLAQYADEIKTNYKLNGFESKNGQITKLKFDEENISVGKNDVVISALDAYNFSQIFGGPQFDFNGIINIFYRTSMALTLPENKTFMCIKNSFAQWIFVNKNTLSVTISTADNLKIPHDELAKIVWKEVCGIRGRQAAFMPAYKVVEHKKATIRQNEKNQSRRPLTPKTSFQNMFVIGDWTYADLPCSMEAAVQSAERLRKFI